MSFACQALQNLTQVFSDDIFLMHHYSLPPPLFLFLDGTPTTQVNKVLSHPTLPVIITAHEDKYICFFDSKSGMHLRGGGGREKEREGRM